MATNTWLTDTVENAGPQYHSGSKRKLGEIGRPIFRDIGNTITRSSNFGRENKSKGAQERGIETTKIQKTDKTKKIDDIDEENKRDLFYMTEYVSDIFTYLRDLEDRWPLQCRFLQNHKISPKARATLIDWLAEVHYTYNLLIDTFHRTVSIIDRYMGNQTVPIGRDDLQLIGITSLFIAIKYEECEVVDIQDLVFICDGAVSKDQIVTMEMSILETIEFCLGVPVTITFLRRYSQAARTTPTIYTLSKYFADLAHLEYSLSEFKASLRAAACTYLALCVNKDTLDPSLWTNTLVYYTTYQYKDFAHLLPTLSKLILDMPMSPLRSLRQQYSRPKYYSVSSTISLLRGRGVLSKLSR